MATNNYKQELAAIKAEIPSIVVQMEKWDQAIIQNSNNAAGSGQTYTANLKNTNALIRESIEIQKTMSAQLGNQAKQTEKLSQKKNFGSILFISSIIIKGFYGDDQNI